MPSEEEIRKEKESMEIQRRERQLAGFIDQFAGTSIDFDPSIQEAILATLSADDKKA
jgi:hypothetical protein